MQLLVPNDYSPEVQKLIPAFPKTGPVKYRLLIDTGGKIDTLNERNEIVPNKQAFGSPTHVTAQTTIFDPFKGEDVTINVSRSNRVQGQGANQFLAPVLDYIVFNRMGEVDINAQQQGQYRFLELHPKNRNNVLTGIDSANVVVPAEGWLFERIEPEKTAKQIANNQRLTDEVRAIIGKNSYSENQAIARRLTGKLRFDSNVNQDMLFSLLRHAAEVDPEQVFRATTDETGKLEALVNEAITANLITFDHLTRTWTRSATAQKIIEIPSGDPHTGLIAWLLDSQGAASRNWLKQAVVDTREVPKKEKPKGMKIEEGQPVPEGYKKGQFGLYYPIAVPAE